MPRSKVLLLGIETQIGLTIIRELGRRGVEVHGIASSIHALGLYSRYLRRGYQRAEGAFDMLAQLRRLSAALAPCHIMAISENDIDFLNQSRSQLPGVKILVPNEQQMELVLDKSVTQRYAEGEGVRTPVSIEITSLADVAPATRDIHFPVVTKWKSPLRVMPALKRAGISLEKVRYCLDRDGLERYMSQFAGVGEFPLIQEYCPGYGLGQFIFMHHGEPILKFQHRRIHEYPPEGGFSTLCESLPGSEHVELMERSVAMLRRMGWEGAAMVEYRFNAATNEARLMEINGRFWGSLPLAYYSGAEFAWLTYAVMGEGMEDERCTTRSGVRCRAFVTETKRLWRIVFAPDQIQDPSLHFSRVSEVIDYVREFFNLRTHYFVFAWNDPKPFFADMFYSLISRVRGR